MQQYNKVFSEDLAKKIQQTEKETGVLYLSNGGELPLTSSKVGGIGYFPKDDTYPIGGSGKPLSLLAQLNFAELTTIDGYPTEGILAFYVDEHDDLLGANFDDAKDQTGYQVYYFEDITKPSLSREELSSFPTPEYKIASGEYGITCVKKQRPLLAENYEFEQHYGQEFYDFFEAIYGDDIDDKLDEAFELLMAGSGNGQIGGYPFFTQTDPRLYEKDLQSDILLFQLDSTYQDGIEVMWGDMGIGNFFIHPDDLKNKQFHKAWYNWDCH